ncbi:MAG: hypothetical protein WCA78_13335 [Rhizomicrobium sp.]|jgi:hypothetical protein
MRIILIAALLSSATAASAQEASDRALSLRMAPFEATSADGEKLSSSRRDAVWAQGELVGDALGNWLGVHNGRLDVFVKSLAAAGENGPTIAGTIRKNAAEIQLRWHPDE